MVGCERAFASSDKTIGPPWTIRGMSSHFEDAPFLARVCCVSRLANSAAKVTETLQAYVDARTSKETATFTLAGRKGTTENLAQLEWYPVQIHHLRQARVVSKQTHFRHNLTWVSNHLLYAQDSYSNRFRAFPPAGNIANRTFQIGQGTLVASGVLSSQNPAPPPEPLSLFNGIGEW